MITGDVRNKVDRVWDAFWTGGISNPLEVIEQITCLLFLKRLDERQLLAERRSLRTGEALTGNPFPAGNDDKGRPFGDMRWGTFSGLDPAGMYQVVSERAFPFLRSMGGDDSTYAHNMRDARFTIPTPNLLARVVGLLDQLPISEQDTKGDIYEYMLAKIATAGQNGQFRTPRHIIQLMVEMLAPGAGQRICDPACGTAGFLVASAEYLRDNESDWLKTKAGSDFFHHRTFSGYDFDNTMLRIGSMNMMLHNVEQPDISYRDSLSEGAAEDADRYDIVLANPPFAGSLDYESTSKDLLRTVKTRKTELLFLALFLRLLRPGGRAAVIVPDGVLFGSTKAHKDLRRLLVEEHKLDAVVKLPSGVFRPYAGVSTAILFFQRTDSGGTDSVWFYEVRADGYSLDDKRNALLPEDGLGPDAELTPEELEKNNLPDVLRRWGMRTEQERARARTEQSFCVPKADIEAQGYDLSLNRYKEVVHEEIEHRSPEEILDELERIEKEIADGLVQLRGMLA